MRYSPKKYVPVLLALTWLSAPLVAQEIIAVKADRVDTVAKGVIQNGIIIIRDGRISKIGADIKIPEEAEIIDAKELTVFPGLINPYSRLGISSGGGSSTPHYRVVDELYPHQDTYKRILEAGFTTLSLIPPGGTIAGQGVVVRPFGENPEEMIVAEPGLLMVNFRTGGSAKKSLKSALESGKKKPTSTDPKVAPLAKVVKGELSIFINCNAPADTLHLIKLIKDYDKLKLSLICGSENIFLAKELAKKKIPVILPARIDYERYTTNRINVPRILAQAGVKIACYPVSDTATGHEDFLRQMANLIKTGLDKDIAKKAITLHPAQMLGLEYRLGSLEVGKDANMLILSGDPLDTATEIHRIMIEGKTVYQKP